jgi:hypothetical protein
VDKIDDHSPKRDEIDGPVAIAPAQVAAAAAKLPVG